MQSYALAFSAIAVSVQQDLVEITAPAAGAVRIHGIVLAQTSDHGDAAAEALQLLFIRGHATSGSVGASATPVLMSTKSGAAASICEINNTTIASTGSPLNLLADAWNVQAGYQIWFPPEMQPVLRNSERGVLRQSAPVDAITQSGTIYFTEE